MDSIAQPRYLNQQQHPVCELGGAVISIFSIGENLEAIKLLDMKKPPANKKLKLTDFCADIQPVAKDEYEVHALENECL